MLAELYPKSFAQVYPRKYSVPGGYGSPKKTAACLSVYLEADEETLGHSSAAAAVKACALGLSALQVPTYWVSRPMLEAAAATKPPSELCPGDLKLPLPSMLFMLPQDAIPVPEEDPLFWIGFTLAETFNGKHRLVFCAGNSISTVTKCYEAGDPLGQQENHSINFVSPETGEDWSQFLSSEFRSVPSTIGAIGINLIMLMSSRPELVECPTPHNTVAANDGRQSNNKLWSPNWIGRQYRRPEAVHYSSSGNHSSPQMHWRRGHWRHQPCGPQRSQRKDVWIEPCLVAAEQAA